MSDADVRHNPFPVAHRVKLDTDAIHPQALVTAFGFLIEQLEKTADEQVEAIDWGTVRMSLEPTTEENTTRMRITAKRFM